jgi:hypothetical protein
VTVTLVVDRAIIVAILLSILLIAIMQPSNTIMNQRVFAVSPSFVRQEVGEQVRDDWTLSGVPYNGIQDVRSGRLFYLKTATDLSECKSFNIEPFPSARMFPSQDLTSVSYNSDNRTLNATFWLTRPFSNPSSINNDHTLSNITSSSPSDYVSNLHQDFVNIYVYESNSTLEGIKNELILTQNLTLDKFYVFENESSSNDTLANSTAYRLVYGGVHPNPSTLFGTSEYKAMHMFTKRENLVFEVVLMSEKRSYPFALDTAKKMIESFNIDAAAQPRVIEVEGTPEDNIYNDTISNKDRLHNITIVYPWNWGWQGQDPRSAPLTIETLPDAKVVSLFSNLHDSTLFRPFFLEKEYTVSFDVDSVYDSDLDYMVSIYWSAYNQTWTKIIEEVSMGGQHRVIDIEPNYTGFFKEGEEYVQFPIDLGILKHPDQYQMIFTVSEIFVVDHVLCHLVDLTQQVAVPAPEFSVQPSEDSLIISPGETKTIELTIQSSAKIPSNVTLTPATKNEKIDIVFNPANISISPSGSAVSKLTLKNDFWSSWANTSPETIAITAEMTFPASLFFTTSSTFYRTVTPINTSGSAALPQASILKVEALNLIDSFYNSLESLSPSINVIVALAGIVGTIGGGVGGWFLRYFRDRQRKAKEDRTETGGTGIA